MAEAMRICLITTSYPRGEDDPAGHFVRAEARKLEREGHTVVVIAPEPENTAFGWPGVAARLRAKPWRILDAARWMGAARRALVRELPVDRVICHWAVPCAWPIAVGAGCPVDIVSHGADVRLLLWLPSIARRALVRHIARHATTWRFVSDGLRDALLEELPDHDAALVARISKVEPCAIELPDVRAASARLRADARTGGPLYVVVGRLVASKCVDVAIEHVARGPRDARLVVIGDGPERARLERLAAKRGVDARFEGVLPRTDALAWIGAADAVLHASRAEGLSTVVREAESMGVPVRYLAGLAGPT